MAMLIGQYLICLSIVLVSALATVIDISDGSDTCEAGNDSCSQKDGTPLKFLVFLGSTRDGRMVSRVSKAFQAHVKSTTNHEMEILDPLELDLPVLRQPIHFYKDKSEIPPILTELNEKIKAADVFVAISAEYNRMVPPALTNILNYFPPASYGYRTSGIITYSRGGAGGLSAGIDLRKMLVELGCSPVSQIAGLGQVSDVIDENGVVQNESVTRKFDRLLKQLIWYGTALKNMRNLEAPPSVAGNYQN